VSTQWDSISFAVKVKIVYYATRIGTETIKIDRQLKID